MEKRAISLLARLDRVPQHKLAPSPRSRLSKCLRSEIRFIHGFAELEESIPNCTNLGYLEAVVQLVQHPRVDAVSAVFQTFKAVNNVKSTEVHVDIVCTFQGKPAWIIVSDRNPRYLHWFSEQDGVMSWRSRVEQLGFVARSLTALQPAMLLFCFAKGVPDSFITSFVEEGAASRVSIFEEDETMTCIENVVETMFDTDEEDWVYIRARKKPIDVKTSSFETWDMFKVEISVKTLIDGFEVLDKEPWGCLCLQNLNSKDSDLKQCGEELERMENDGCTKEFRSLLSTLSQNAMPSHGDRGEPSLVNLDTTALIALVSEISNGGAPMLASMSYEDSVSKFKSTAQFMKDQAEEELRVPLLMEMKKHLGNRRAFISESVCKEFKSLVSLCGGSAEKGRANELLKYLPVVPDMPSARVMDLCETGNIKLKNKVVFGTGDSWQAPTLTANLSFVRAVQQTGMALSILEHKPRALMGDKCG